MIVSPDRGIRSSCHVAVMPREVIDALRLQPGLTVLDGTVGAGGHSELILSRIEPDGRLIGIDRDPMMLKFAAQRLLHPQVALVQGSYVDAGEILADLDVGGVDRVLLDLGLSSDQLADRDRGFGFDSGGDLDMRFDTETGRSVADFLQSATIPEIANVIHEFGEERHARRIAEAIGDARRSGSPLNTTDDLIACINSGLRQQQHRRPDRSTLSRVFQALRVFVNDELDHVHRMMNDVLPSLLNSGGIAAVISFHSLEDRIVKQAFRNDSRWQSVTKTPQEASPAEVRLNPRARSARLRSAQWGATLENASKE